MTAPAALWASDRFRDVPTDNPFHDQINDIAEAGITTGCAEDRYCPTDPVTRQQMAAFLHRMRGVGHHDPVVNADTVDGRDARELAWTGGVPIQVFHRIQHFDVDNPENNEEECIGTTSDFEDGADTPDGAYTVTFQLTAVPDADDFGPWDVNVAVAFVDEGAFDVCFATIDGRELPDGRYSTFRQEMVTIGVS